VQRAVSRGCEARRIFCLAVDDVANASAFGGSVVRRPPFVVAISSSGAAPALTRLLRTVVEHVLPPDSFVERARALRGQWKRDGIPMGERFGRLVREATKGT
jgi:siroheme synthase-like protein